jgi:putative aldouronate transport system substrate-binding protein
MKRMIMFVLMLTVLSAIFTGCGSKEVSDDNQDSNSEIIAVNELGNTVEDSSDLPDWKGKKLNLRMWYAQGTGALNRLKKSENDVVTPELYRVTGVKYDEESSFDNGGELMDARIAKIMAANDWPDIVLNPERAVLEKMIEADMVYDLTDLIPKYCTNMTSVLRREDSQDYLKSEREDGKLYTFSYNVRLSYAAPDLDPNLIARVELPTDPTGYIYVRDDILKKLYPSAKTQNEIESLYVENGKFSKEDILDVTFNNKEEFFEFLYKIKELGIKEGNREVYPIYVADGIDNWSLLAILGSLYGYNRGSSANVNYFTYWDKEKQKVEYMFKQDFFKEILKDWTKLVQDDIASPESLIDNRAAFEEKVNNGLYAVIYGQALPDQNVLNAAGKPFKYRKVYMNIPANTDKFLFTESAPNSGSRVAILKNQVKEEDLEQVLRFYDFMWSEAGQKLTYWGPRSAGLWTEENGNRVFIDKELEESMVYDKANDKKLYYGLENSGWPGYPTMGSSRYAPKIVYNYERKPSMANRYFSMGIIEPGPKVIAKAPDIWLFDGYGIQGVQKFWQARQAFEDALTKIFIAKNDDEFEQLYKEMLALAERNGLTGDVLVEINKAYREYINVDYMDNLVKK